MAARLALSDLLSGTWRSKQTAAACLIRPRASSRTRDLALLVRLDHVALLEVLVVLEPDAALEALAHLTHVLLEAAKRCDRALPDDRALTKEPDLRPARDDTVRDVAAGDTA